MERRGLILLGGVALLLGAATPMLASASEYDEIGTVDEGVYEVRSEESSFRVQAEEPLGLFVRAVDGSVVDATRLDAGEQRTVLLDAQHATLALTSGEATIEAEGEGSVQPLAANRDNLTLAEANGTSVDRSLAVQVPEGALLASAVLDGQARQLDLHVEANGDTLLDADQRDLQTHAALAPTAAKAQALDVRLDAQSLDGSLELAFLTLPEIEASQAESSADRDASGDALNASVDASQLDYEPVRFTVEDSARLTVEIDSGYLFDASVYDADGEPVHHLHAGPSLADHRSRCDNDFECWDGYDYEEMAPRTIEHELDAGDYLLFVREGAVEGTLTIEDAEGQPLLPEAEVLDVTTIDVHEDRELELDEPLLDVWRSFGYDDGELQPRVSAAVEDQEVFSYEALAAGGGYAAESSLEMAPAAMQAGPVTVTVDEAGEELQPDRHGASLVVPAR